MSKPYHECPNCGAPLDHGEHCDCKDRWQEPGSGSTERRTTGNRKPARARTHARRIGARYEVCGECGLEWNVSKDLALPWYGYRCPRCRSKWKRIERSNT